MTDVRYVRDRSAGPAGRRVEVEAAPFKILAPGDRIVLGGLLQVAGTVLAVRRHRSPRYAGWRYRLEVRLDGPRGDLVNPEGSASRRAARIVHEAAEASS